MLIACLMEPQTSRLLNEAMQGRAKT